MLGPGLRLVKMDLLAAERAAMNRMRPASIGFPSGMASEQWARDPTSTSVSLRETKVAPSHELRRRDI
jgi:hypothetical protein